MIKAQRGLLERASLEDKCLVADGKDTSYSFRAVPVFTRPTPASRSRSCTCTSTSKSSGVDTPPLSPSDGSSISGGSMSSIDLNDVNIMLSNTTHPTSTLATARNRARTQGTGHRRRYSKAHISRSSVYETIEEESNASSSEADHSDLCAAATKKLTGVESSPTAIYVVDEDTQSFVQEDISMWDDERGILALRKYYTLKDEATTTVMESQRVWEDTPFSAFADQTFDPPRQPDAMQALLEHSVRNYVLLPAELRCIRSRKDSSTFAVPSSWCLRHPFLNSALKRKHLPLPFLYINNVALI